jgi:hypothetical protein
MKYILLIYQEENSRNATTHEACEREARTLIQELTSKGQYLGAAPLHPTSTATSVRIRNGKPLVTDGPFAETHEQLGGFYLIDTTNLDEAIEIARQIAGSHSGTVEIRPIREISEMPPQ